MSPTPKRNIALAMSGASGAPYFFRLLERLAERHDVALHLIVSDSGKRVVQEEMGETWRGLEDRGHSVHSNKNIGASVASGSFQLDALVVVPCSMNSLSGIAYGFANNLLLRCAAVQLKERRNLILVPRETPLSLVNLRAMVAAAEAGALILPAMPSFYQNPESLMDVVDTVVDRVIDQLGLEDSAVKRWPSC